MNVYLDLVGTVVNQQYQLIHSAEIRDWLATLPRPQVSVFDNSGNIHPHDLRGIINKALDVNLQQVIQKTVFRDHTCFGAFVHWLHENQKTGFYYLVSATSRPGTWQEENLQVQVCSPKKLPLSHMFPRELSTELGDSGKMTLITVGSDGSAVYCQLSTGLTCTVKLPQA